MLRERNTKFVSRWQESPIVLCHPRLKSQINNLCMPFQIFHSTNRCEKHLCTIFNFSWKKIAFTNMTMYVNTMQIFHWGKRKLPSFFCLLHIQHGHFRHSIIFYHGFCKDQREAAVIILPRYVTMGYEKWYTSLLSAQSENIRTFSSSKSCQLHVLCRFYIFDVVMTLYISY